MSNRRCRCLPALVAAMLVLGCAVPPTTLDAQWLNPAFAGKGPVRQLMVMSAVQDSTNRRIFEDQMVVALGAAGVAAVQSYKLIPEDGPVSEERLQRAAAEAGMSHAVTTRIVYVANQINVMPGMMMGPTWGPGWGWGWGWGWGGAYPGAMWATAIPPQVTTTQNVHADTRLFAAGDATVIWSAATTTSANAAPTAQMIEQFVQLIVNAMKADGVI